VAEVMAKREVEEKIEFPIQSENKFKELLETKTFLKEPELRNFLHQYQFERSDGTFAPLNYDRPNKMVYQAILEYFKDKDPKIQNCLAIYRTLMRLNNLRNQSIGAHNFDPISLNLIYSNLATAEELEKLKQKGLSSKEEKKEIVKHIIFSGLREYFQIKANPYDELTTFIKRHF
jgi:hypothetical protein